ncbi:MAG TPA: PAS domain S-box protein [Allosphingosinicella sp.]
MSSSTWKATERAPSSAVYRALFDNSDLAFYVIAVMPDGSFRFEDANVAVAAFQIRPAESLSGSTPADGLIPEIASCLEENLALCLETGKAHSYDRSMDLPNGRMSWTTSLTPIANGYGGVDHIVGVTRNTTGEKRLKSAVEQKSSMMAGIEATAGGFIYLFDLRQRCNVHVGGKSSLGYAPDELKKMGGNLLSQLIHPDDMAESERHLRALGRLPDGEVAAHEYRMRHKDGHYIHCLSRQTVFRRDAAGEVELILGISIDVTQIKGMEQELRHLSRNLATLRSDERRRIAEDLHDGTGQRLAAAKLGVARIQADYSAGNCGPSSASMDEALADVMAEIRQAEREIRVHSFLFHSPSIESARLPEAVQSLVEGFGSRAGLEADLKVDPGAGLLPEDIAIALYRVCQEALTNVHRHARATRVFVSLDLSQDEVSLTIGDDGIGFDASSLAGKAGSGLGLRGMRDRIEELGGSFDLQCDGGVTISAKVSRPSLPFPQRTNSRPA